MSYAGPIQTVSPVDLAEAGWVRRFWQLMPAESEFGALLTEDFQQPARCCRVHGDLTRANMLPSDNNMWIIDWELSDPLGPWKTDYVTFFLGERQRRLVRQPRSVMNEFQQTFLSGKSAEEQREVRLAVAFLFSRGSGFGTRIVAAWE